MPSTATDVPAETAVEPAAMSGWWPGGSHRKWAFAAVAFVVALVFFVHFRPWQGGLLEEWGFVVAWDAQGIQGLFDRMPAMLARPLHLVPYYVGLVISDGGLVGQYVTLAAVAVGQLFAAVWALRPLTRDRLLQWTAATALALHPWWIAGDLLRFLPAQVSVLAMVVWWGASVRFLEGARRRWLVLGTTVALLGLLTYQGPAFPLLVGAAVLALGSSAAWRSRLWLVGATTAVVLSVTLWSVVLAPRLSSASYEAELTARGVDVPAAGRAIVRTLAVNAPEVVAMGLALGLLVVALGFYQVVSAQRAWLLLGGLVAAPAGAFAYGASVFHLNDPERVAFPVGLTFWLILCCALPALERNGALRSLTVGATVVGTLAGAVVGYGIWTEFGVAQQSLITAVEAVREDAPADATVVVADRTGRYGDVYTLFPPHLDLALDATFGDGPQTLLCTPEGVARLHPTAAVYPLATTPDCVGLLAGAASEPPIRLETVEGPVDVYVVER